MGWVGWDGGGWVGGWVGMGEGRWVGWDGGGWVGEGGVGPAWDVVTITKCPK